MIWHTTTITSHYRAPLDIVVVEKYLRIKHHLANVASTRRSDGCEGRQEWIASVNERVIGLWSSGGLYRLVSSAGIAVRRPPTDAGGSWRCHGGLKRYATKRTWRSPKAEAESGRYTRWEWMYIKHCGGEAMQQVAVSPNGVLRPHSINDYQTFRTQEVPSLAQWGYVASAFTSLQ